MKLLPKRKLFGWISGAQAGVGRPETSATIQHIKQITLDEILSEPSSAYALDTKINDNKILSCLGL